MTRSVVLSVILMGMCVVNAESQDLSLRLFVHESTICQGAKQLKVQLELKNVGSEPVEVDAAAVGNAFDAIALYNTETNTARFESLQVTGDRMTTLPRRSQLLEPGAMCAVQGVILLEDKFFAEPGFYKIRTDYFDRGEGQPPLDRPRESIHVTSNWVILQVEPCSPDRRRQP